VELSAEAGSDLSVTQVNQGCGGNAQACSTEEEKQERRREGVAIEESKTALGEGEGRGKIPASELGWTSGRPREAARRDRRKARRVTRDASPRSKSGQSGRKCDNDH